MLFCVFRGTMARTDWLGDMGTGFGKAVLGIALNFGVFFVEKSRMARIDWGGLGSATHGKDMEKKRRREAFEEGWTGRGIGERDIGQK